MLTKFVFAILERVGERLLLLAYEHHLKRKRQGELDIERGSTNEKNLKAYSEAKTRAERVSAALDLLNRNPASGGVRDDAAVPDKKGL